MKIENLKLALQYNTDLKNIDKQIAEAQKFVDTKMGFKMKQFDDNSGICVDYVYVNHNYPVESYVKIAKVVLKEFTSLRKKLIREIKKL